MPSPLPVKMTPAGSAPVSVRAAADSPLVVTVNVPAVPAVNAAAVALVIDGAWPDSCAVSP